MEVDGVNLNYEVVGDGPHNVLLSPGLAGKKIYKSSITYIYT